MNNEIVENTSSPAINLAHLSTEFGKAKELVDDVIDKGKHKAERLAKHASFAVEECVEDTTYYIKKHPWQSVGVAACVGIATGLLVSLALFPFGNRPK